MNSATVELRDLLGNRLSQNMSARLVHSGGEAVNEHILPDAVAFPNSTLEVSKILEICSRFCVPVVPFGAGTSLEGQVQAAPGGISIDLSGLQNIISTSVADLEVHIEAGLTREALNRHLLRDGLFFPIDPGANATLGGMAATRASGTNAVRYGTMRDVVLGLTVVLPTGQIISTGSRARKSAAGYDLTRLYIGSEGTLGIITELRLRVAGLPEAIAAATCQFSSLADAVGVVSQLTQLGVPIARVELLDAVQMGACIRYSKLTGMAPAPTLFFEFHGNPGGVDADIATVAALTRDAGGTELLWATLTEERSRLWKARHDAYWAARSLAPSHDAFATDACVPLSALAAAIEESVALAEDLGLICPIAGHVGDGNFHMLVLYESHNKEARARADMLAHGVARIALRHGGTITGEHGVGLHKLDLMRDEHGDALDVMRAIKQALDPLGIMNPGKTIPPGPIDIPA